MINEEIEIAEPTDEDVFVEKSDWGWIPVPLSPGRSIQLVRLVGEILAGGVGRLNEILSNPDGTRKDEMNNADLFAVLEVLTEEQVIRLMSIITGKSTEWVTKNWNLLSVATSLAVFWKNENLGKVGEAVSYALSTQPTALLTFPTPTGLPDSSTPLPKSTNGRKTISSGKSQKTK